MTADPHALAAKVAYLHSLCGPGDEAIETHFAWVFLVGTHAWKLRKPVRRDTMDFRSLEARRLDALEDVRLNRRLAPTTYLGASPLVITPTGEFVIDGAGEIVDWLVGMRRLDRRRLLDVRLQQGTVTERELESVARLLAAFYRSSPPALTDGAAFIRRLARQIEANRRVLHGAGLPGGDALCEQQNEFLAREAALLLRRAEGGCVVEAHGDLRPEHVFLDEPPAIIDCLEFDRELRLLDRAEELSFLELECARTGHGATGRRIARSCLGLMADDAPDALLDFYRSHRAATRAKLYVWRADEPDGNEPDTWVGRARSYLGDAREAVARSLG